MMSYIYVFVGGGIGSMLRYGVSRLMLPYINVFPWATLVANVVSCVILGAMMGWTMREEVSAVWRLMIMTGICGGFSTFSTFTAETFVLFEQGEHLYALMNVGLNLLVCLACIFVGLKLAY